MTAKITPGFAEHHRADVARLFWEAFGQKLSPALGRDERALRFITQGLRADFAISATGAEGALLGVAGFKTQRGGLLAGTYTDLRALYGPIGAFWRGAVLDQFGRPLEEGTLQMDGIFVAEGARGQGVGTQLLDAVIWTARMNRYARVRLDVIEGNPRAKALYARRGFREAGRLRAGVLAPLVGFREATTMFYDLADPAPDRT